MIIKEEKNKRKIFFSFRRLLYLYFYSTIIALLFLSVAILQSQTFQQAKNQFLNYLSIGGRYEYLYLPQITYKALKSFFYKLDKVDLEIRFDDILIIENVRKNAIEKKALPPADVIPKVKASISFNGKKYRGDIRLKGDRSTHFEDKKKSSYKIELDRNQYISGIKKFSLQKPRIRNYVHEWIFHKMAEDFDIIKLKYDFVNLSINGEDKGLYVIEEGFGKELIERNERRNGPIFGLNEDVYAYYDNPVFEVYNKKFWSRVENSSLSNIASQKLRDFFSNKLYIEDVFDLEKWAAYFAVIDITANYHGGFLKSVKFYYNPINGLFEPIPFDGHRLKPNYHKYNLNYDNRILIDIAMNPRGDEIPGYTWLKKFFFKNEKLNQEFYNLYMNYLNNVSSNDYLDNFLEQNLEKIEKINSHIYSDYFYYDNSRNYGVGLYYFLLDDFFYQAKNIQDKLKAKRKMQVLKINDSEFIIKNYYKNYGALLVDRFICEKDNHKVEIRMSEPIKNFSNTIIKLNEENTKNLFCSHIKFVDRNNEDSILLKIDHLNSDLNYTNFKKKEFKNLHKYFVLKKNNFFLLKDEILIDENLYIPKGYKVVIKSNQKLTLINNSFIISNSPWIADGRNGKISIGGQKNNFGGGILITDTKQKSIFENVIFSYLAGAKKSYAPISRDYFVETITGYRQVKKNNYREEIITRDQEYDNPLDAYNILGSINIHNTKVNLKNILFYRIASEDALNIISSEFSAKNLKFNETASDAIDVDFGRGKFEKASFEYIGNDAIDLSGSMVEINKVKFHYIGDKLISVGENSFTNINDVEADESYAGIVSKDGSIINVSNVNMKNVKIPFASYKKKKEYDFARMNLSKINVEDFYFKWLTDKESVLIYEKENVGLKTKNIIPIIYNKNLSIELIKN